MFTKLREISELDTANIIKWRNSPNVRNNFIFQQTLTSEDHANWLNNNVKTGKAAQFIIVDTIDGEQEFDIGSVYLRDIDMRNKKAEFGIFIGEDRARGKGHGSNAVSLILDYAFNVVGLNRVFLRVFADNLPAIKSYQKSGFVHEGLFKQDVIINGKGIDMVFMAVLKSGWALKKVENA